MSQTIIEYIGKLFSLLPIETLQYSFMQQALLATLLLAPLMAAAGVHVVNFRMAFLADTIGHSAFTGVAIGILLSLGEINWALAGVALFIGLGVLYLKRNSDLSGDTAIGVFFALVVSVGLLLNSRLPENSQNAQMFLYGDILTVQPQDIAILFWLCIGYAGFEFFAFNRLLSVSVDETVARCHGIKTRIYTYLHIGILALITVFAVKSIGVLLAGAMLTVPAAAARNLVKQARWVSLTAIMIGVVSGVTGLLVSALPQVNTAAGAAMVFISCIIFAVTLLIKKLRSYF